jgi:dimethylamine/trimethylamine dehydrogenase
MTNEQPGIHQALAKCGVALRTLEIATGFDGKTLNLAQIFSGEPRELPVQSLVIVGQRAGGSALFDGLAATELAKAGIRSLRLTGDANAPGAIAHAVYQGHKTARETGMVGDAVVRRDGPFVSAEANLRATPRAAQ